jgi:RNA polymerase sigma factor (sigma-70 family)
MMSNEMDSTDEKSQWELLVGCMPALHSYVRRAVGSRDAANDVVQEVSIRVLTGEGPREPARFLAWSRGIARHVIALDWRMRRRALAELPLEEDLVHEHPQAVWDPERHIDARKSLARAIVDIDSEGLELLVRRYVFEETGKELADEMAQSPAALRMRLMRLRSTLSARVRPDGTRKAGAGSAQDGSLTPTPTPIPISPPARGPVAAPVSYTTEPTAPPTRRSPAPPASSSAPIFHHHHSQTASTHTG